MKPPRSPLYLARETFRRRRTMDAARLLPVLGVFLFLLPRLWDGGDGGGAQTAREGLYIFAVWAGLIVAAAALARWLTPAPEADDRRDPAARAAPHDAPDG